ncbi:MAG: peptidylprolyl isomerase [Gammaproteobacteria bacterium]|nr:peptidylprolyl isomerase [Gammaproteobacteria bacterium]
MENKPVKVIEPGDRVRLHLSITLEDGTVVEDTFADDPIDLVMGDGSLIAGLEYALYGLRAGSREKILITAKDAYGVREEGAIYPVLRNDFPDDMEIKPGSVVSFSLEGQGEVPALVIAVEDEQVQVDFNHPLAGHDILLKTEILLVEALSSEDHGE